MAPKITLERERFDAKWMLAPITGCWLWTGARNDNGYGYFYGRAHRSHGAHRYSWMLYRGPIPDGMVIDHLCHVRACVNPDHLRVVSQKANALENSDCVSALNAKKTHCPRGHEYTEANTYHRANAPGAYRACRACGREKKRERRAAIIEALCPNPDQGEG